MKLLRRIGLILLGLIALIYAGDYLSVRIPIPKSRAPLATVTVRPTYDVGLKSGKSDFYILDAQQMTCVNSLFPHMGYPPCWYLRKHTHPDIKV
jgi:hypothetical protein